MTATKIMLTDANTGDFVLELPMRLSQPYNRVLNGTGSLSGTVPMDAPGVSAVAVFERYEITVLEDTGSGFLPDWNGPIVSMNIDKDARVYEITAQETSAIFAKRTVEDDKDYSGWDAFDILRDLFDYMTTKTSTAGDTMTGSPGVDINAAIPRFSVSPSSGASGYVITEGAVPASGRYLVSAIFERIVNDPDNPIDWRMDYRTGSTSTACHRTLVLGAPLGTSIAGTIANSDLFAGTKEMDRLRSANRVHVVGGTSPVTLQNESDIVTNNDVLLEAVFSLPEGKDATQYARAARAVSYPPITDHTFTFTDGLGSFAPGFCQPGDTIDIGLSDASFTSIGHRRVAQVGKLPETPENPRLFVVDITTPLDVLTS